LQAGGVAGDELGGFVDHAQRCGKIGNAGDEHALLGKVHEGAIGVALGKAE
jgi:hypothetical protein